MDFGHYASRAVDLVNSDISTDAELRAYLGPSTATAARVASRDVAVLRRARGELREVFEAGAGGDEPALVGSINRMLGRYPISPRISGHDNTSWHLHVNEEAAVGAALVAESVFGLMLVVTQLGANRFGICGAPDCDRVFVDTSPNRSKRFCGDRCATRTNVAAFRRRRSAAKAS
ncbi:CGNR zinc finger domain-containing protein [Acidiferrimicrobium sp. IK]|uniref:CGNR zinc finger domain-containing protein n=1 Tax=Acidiferrimicrobium sp. IK TaxID=2871700 RepID=UPI0021CAFE95|nr:CGNR zinc finger domain-containing protein [Acidiferrimicrobium sp. IK]MCU4185002.1 CGNR zinc finger domain-containing protein [Acidiferrimicrobium sp. IK]